MLVSLTHYVEVGGGIILTDNAHLIHGDPGSAVASTLWLVASEVRRCRLNTSG